MSGLMPDKNINIMLGGFDVLIATANTISEIFTSPDFEGQEFCAGLIIARKVNEVVEDVVSPIFEGVFNMNFPDDGLTKAFEEIKKDNLNV